MTAYPHGRLSRRAALSALAGGVAAVAGAPALAAPALNTGKGAFRRIRFNNARLEERLDTVYWIDGAYIPEAMAEISRILRDWRAEEVKGYHPAAIDVLAAAHRRMETQEPYEIISGYRCPETNAMLRKRSSGVAKRSYHLRAMAVDVTMESRSVAQMARAAESLSAGGVGRYSRSEFVHMDCGPVRSWGS